MDTIEAFLGTCVHETLEELHRLRLRGRVLSEEQALEAFESEWAKSWSDTIRIVSEKFEAGDYKRAGREALVPAFAGMTAAFAGMTAAFAGMTAAFAGMTAAFAGMTAACGGMTANDWIPAFAGMTAACAEMR